MRFRLVVLIFLITGSLLTLLYTGVLVPKNVLKIIDDNELLSIVLKGGIVLLGILCAVSFSYLLLSLIRRKNTLLSVTSRQQCSLIDLPIGSVIPGNAQHIGKRTEQQDAFAFSDISNKDFTEQFGVLSILADGMGGLSGGKEASQLAVQAFLNHYVQTTYIQSIPDKLVSAVEVANDAVLQFARENGLEGGVGTTLIAAVVVKNQLYWLSVGDSRIYLVQNGALTQLTSDHIYGKELDEKVAKGEISKEEADNDPQRESLTNFLGLQVLGSVDVAIEPLLLQSGDTVLLCSDGLYGSVTNNEMIKTCSTLSAQMAAEKLISLMLHKQRPNQDNATVALLKIS